MNYELFFGRSGKAVGLSAISLSVVNSSMHEIARGIVRYNGDELRKIIGHNSDEIGTILGYEHGHVAIHYDDLVLV